MKETDEENKINDEDNKKEEKDENISDDNKNKDENNYENNTFSIDSYLKESNNINKDKDKDKNNKNQSAMDKRKSIPVNSTGTLKLSPISLDDDNIIKESKKNNKTNHISVERSYSQAIIPTTKNIH